MFKKILSVFVMGLALVACKADAREAKMGDTVIIDFVGYMDGEEFPGGRGESYPLMLGSNAFVPGFESGVVGMEEGATKDISLTFPTNYYPDMAGKPVVFKVTLKSIR
jgi:trigger factor